MFSFAGADSLFEAASQRYLSLQMLPILGRLNAAAKPPSRKPLGPDDADCNPMC